MRIHLIREALWRRRAKLGARGRVLTGMGKKLYVGNLSWHTTDEGLRQAFERFGSVTDARVVTDRETGRSRGFGFVTFAQDDDAASAVSGMDGAQLDGRPIKVSEAKDNGFRGGSRSGGYGGGGGRSRSRDEGY